MSTILYENKEKDLVIFSNKKGIGQNLATYSYTWGCHGVGINNVPSPESLNRPVLGSYYGYDNNPPIKDKFNLYLRNYGLTSNRPVIDGDFESVAKMVQLLNAGLANIKQAPEDFADACFKATVDQLKASGYNVFTFCCVLNYDKESRGMKEGDTESTVATYRLVEYIAKNKIGHLSASPVVVNGSHNGKAGSAGLSYVQSFTWFPCNKDRGGIPIQGTTFSRMLDPTIKMLTEEEEATNRNGKVGKLFHNIKDIIDNES